MINIKERQMMNLSLVHINLLFYFMHKVFNQKLFSGTLKFEINTFLTIQ
jgi:hypothetical protein